MLPTCDDPPPAALLAGIAQFNRQEYFECHETLETIWMREPGTIRRLYQGILQIGVGFYHLGHQNYRGTLNLLASGIAYLEPFAPRCLGIDIDHLIGAARSVRATVTELGAARIAEFDLSALPRILVYAPVQLPAEEHPIAAPEPGPGHW